MANLFNLSVYLRAGQAVSRPHWASHEFIQLEALRAGGLGVEFVDESGATYPLDIEDIEADDYTLVCNSMSPSSLFGATPAYTSGWVNYVPTPTALDPWPSYGKSITEYQEPVCECGKDKHGFMAHSTWCQKAGANE